MKSVQQTVYSILLQNTVVCNNIKYMQYFYMTVIVCSYFSVHVCDLWKSYGQLKVMCSFPTGPVTPQLIPDEVT